MSCWAKFSFLLLFFLATLCESKTVSCTRKTIAVLINTGNSQNSSTTTFPVTIKKSFEKLSSTLDIGKDVNIVQKDFNSTFCDLGAFLEFVNEVAGSDIIVVLLLDDCQCEKKFMSYLDILNIKSVSKCERPLFAAKDARSISKQIRKRKNFYLLVAADANGVEFNHDFTFQLARKKLQLRGTLWIGGESIESNQLQKELKNLTESFENNVTSGAYFMLGFLHPNDFRLKSLLNVAKRILRNHFDKILWSFPVVHLDFSKMQDFDESFQALALRESSQGTVDCHHDARICDLSLVLRKTRDVLESCWGNEFHRQNGTKYSENTVTAKCSIQKHTGYRVKNQECNTSQENCYIDLLRLRMDNFIGEKTWRRIGVWNGDKVKFCASEKKTATFISNARTVFRVPIVEYAPFIVKHEMSIGECPPNALTCYGQRLESDNTTVTNYADKYCCSGLEVDVLIYLTGRLSYEFELYFQYEKLFGVYNKSTGTWNGEVHDILIGKGDIVIDLIVRPDRCTALDCSLGYIADGFNAIVKLGYSKGDSSQEGVIDELIGTFKVFRDPFSRDLLIAVLVAFNILVVLIWATDKICLFYRNKRLSRKKEKFTILQSMSYVFAIAFGRDAGDSKKPLTLSGRYLASWLAFLSLILVNVYVAKLMAAIVKEETTRPFTSLHDPRIFKNRLKLGLIKDSATDAHFQNTRDPVLKQLFEKNIKENLLFSYHEGAESVKNGTLDGFLGDTTSLLALLNRDSSCSLSLMGRDFVYSPIAFMFRKDWPWAEEFKLEELLMNDIKRNEDLWIMKRSHLECKEVSSVPPQLSIIDMSGIFVVIMFTAAYSCFTLIPENIYSILVHRYRESKARWNVPHA